MPEAHPISNVVVLGLDLVDTRRFQAALNRHGDRLLQRLFHAEELAYCRVGSASTRLNRLAGRFAAKEAVFKALGGRLYAWHDIHVGRCDNGGPVVALSGRALERARDLGVSAWHISITHTRDQAAAVALGV